MYSDALLTGKDLPLSEALATGGETTVIGLAIVFGVLIILMIVLMLMKVIFYRDPAKQQKAEVIVPEAEPVTEIKAEETDDDELITILTAAVASSLNTSTYNLRIKSYRRTESKQPAWNKAGLTESINNRF